MKNIPLKEALTLAAPGPLTARKHGQIMTVGAAQIAVVTDRLTLESGSTIGNAALLAHFYNLGPELVEMLEELRDCVESDQGPLVRNNVADRATALLAKASTVQMP